MTKSQTLTYLAEKTGVTKTVVETVVNELVALAYQEAKNGFVVPGLGKLVVIDRPARVGRSPATGETINIPAKKVVKFRVAKVCQESVL